MSRPRKQQPNQRLILVASILREVAENTTIAVGHVNEELSCLGFPSSGGGERVSGGSSHDGTSADAQRSFELTEWREGLRDRIAQIERITSDLTRHVQIQLPARERAADSAARCSDGWLGRDGHKEWPIDDVCHELATHHGLCSTHYQRERRWREKHGLRPRGVPAAERDEVTT